MKRWLWTATLLLTRLEAADCHAERIATDDELVYVVSCFDNATYFNALSHQGEFIWEVPFSSNILSWKVKDGAAYVLSKSRAGQANFVTCISIADGSIKWEKTIWAPPSDTTIELPVDQ